MKGFLVLSAAIILSSYIMGIEQFNSYKQFDNVIELVSGKIRLGEVYRETVTTTYEVTFEGDSRPSTSISADTENLYSAVHKDFTDMLNEVNEERRADDKEPIVIDEASWIKDATISLVTKVTYESQYHPRFILTIDETLINYDSDSEQPRVINDYISDLKSYSTEMMTNYEKDKSFIK